MHTSIIASIFLFLSTFALGNEKEKYVIDRLDWEKLPKTHTIIHVENIYGNVHVKKSFDGKFIYHAVAQNHKSRKEKIKLVAEDNNNQISLKVVIPKNIIERERVDVAIIVPEDTDLTVIMNDGQLNAKKIHNPIKVISQTADINLSTKSQFDLFSKDGNINVNFLDGSIKQSSKIQGHNGNLTIQYGDDEPYFEIISGTQVVSNSSRLLTSKKQVKRNQFFNSSESKIKLKISNDTGRIILINQHIK